METKSRYEVISDLERQKRELIRQRDGLNDELIGMNKEAKDTERAKSDQIVAWDRKIADIEEGIANFTTSMKEKKETIKELIKSIDESLDRFGKLSKKE